MGPVVIFLAACGICFLILIGWYLIDDFIINSKKNDNVFISKEDLVRIHHKKGNLFEGIMEENGFKFVHILNKVNRLEEVIYWLGQNGIVYNYVCLDIQTYLTQKAPSSNGVFVEGGAFSSTEKDVFVFGFKKQSDLAKFMLRWEGT